MIDFLRSWSLNIATLAVFIVLLEILLPAGRIKKFVNLVSGLILIIAIINPFIKLAGGKIDIGKFHMSSSNFLDKKEIAANGKIMEDRQMQQIVEVYRKKLIARIEDGLSGKDGITGVKADVIINEDYKSDSFGEIKRVYLSLRTGKKPEGIEPVTRIEKIQIGNEKTATEISGEKGRLDSRLKSAVEERVVKLLGVRNEDVVISLEDK